MPAYVVVQLARSRDPHRARDEHPFRMRRDVTRLLSEHDAELMVSPARDAPGDAPSLSATITVPDMARADKLATALRGLDGIETAYAKPGEELP